MKKEQTFPFKKYMYCFLASMLLFLAIPQNGGGCATCYMEKYYHASEPSFSIGDPSIKPYRKIVRKPNIWRPGRYW